MEVEVREIIEKIKKSAQENPNRPPTAIVREELEDVDDEEILQALPERNTLKRKVNRYQNKNRPRLPEGLEDVVIKPPYDKTLRHRQFLQFDSRDHEDEYEDEDDVGRVLIFYTDKSLECLVRSKIVFCDGTFKVVPLIFYQLYTIHGTVLGHVFPLIYVLTTRKTQQTYKVILSHLKG